MARARQSRSYEGRKLTRYMGLSAALSRIDHSLPSTDDGREDFVWLKNTSLHDGLAKRQAVEILWKLLASTACSVKLQLPDGTQIPAQREWLSPPANLAEVDRPGEGPYVDLSFGLLGTGSIAWDSDARVKGELLVSVKDVEGLIAKLESGVSHSMSLSAMKKRIQQAYRSREVSRLSRLTQPGRPSAGGLRCRSACAVSPEREPAGQTRSRSAAHSPSGICGAGPFGRTYRSRCGSMLTAGMGPRRGSSPRWSQKSALGTTSWASTEPISRSQV